MKEITLDRAFDRAITKFLSGNTNINYNGGKLQVTSQYKVLCTTFIENGINQLCTLEHLYAIDDLNEETRPTLKAQVEVFVPTENGGSRNKLLNISTRNYTITTNDDGFVIEILDAMFTDSY